MHRRAPALGERPRARRGATAPAKPAMPPSKRRRTTAAAASDAPLVHLDGGEPHPAPFVALWRAGRLTDTVVHVEGEAFPASRNVLAAGSAFFDGIFGSGMRDEHEPEVREMAASAFRPCLGFIYEGSCAVEEGLLETVLWAAHLPAWIRSALLDPTSEATTSASSLSEWDGASPEAPGARAPEAEGPPCALHDHAGLPSAPLATPAGEPTGGPTADRGVHRGAHRLPGSPPRSPPSTRESTEETAVYQ